MAGRNAGNFPHVEHYYQWKTRIIRQDDLPCQQADESDQKFS